MMTTMEQRQVEGKRDGNGNTNTKNKIEPANERVNERKVYRML